MTQNFIEIVQKGNYNIITTGWKDLDSRTTNYTGQFDFPQHKTSFIGYKDLSSGTGIFNTGVAITCDSPYKRVNIRARMLTQDGDGNDVYVENLFNVNGEDMNFDQFSEWLYFNTGTTIQR